MKYLKMLALTAVAAGALMALIGTGTASATVLCSTTVEPCPEAQKVFNIPLDFSLVAGTSANLTDTAGEPIETCKESTVKGNITTTGDSVHTVTGPVTSLTFSGCPLTTDVLRLAALEIHKIAGTSNGTLTVDPIIDEGGKETIFEVTINTIFFGSCIYGVTAGTSLGDLTEGKPAIFHANAIVHKLSGSAVACPATTTWKATYQLTDPKETTVSVQDSYK